MEILDKIYLLQYEGLFLVTDIKKLRKNVLEYVKIFKHWNMFIKLIVFLIGIELNNILSKYF